MQHDNTHTLLHSEIQTPEGHVLHRYQCLVCGYDEIKAEEGSEIEHHNSGQLPPNIGLTSNRNSTQAHG